MSPPNWKKFKSISHAMIENLLGDEPVKIIIKPDISYDYENGEIVEGNEETIELKSALIPLNKDDLVELPEGYRDKQVRKLYTIQEISDTAIILTVNDDIQYKVIVPSIRLCAGGLDHAWKTVIAKIETDIRQEDVDNTEVIPDSSNNVGL